MNISANVEKKTLRERVRANDFTLGSWLALGDENIAEIMAQAGFDWLVIDMEHSALSISQVLRLIRIIQLCGTSALVRVSSNDGVLIKRVMDSGADGVIVPMVNSRDNARAAVDAVHYPPKGKRGVGLWRAQGYGHSFEEYKERLSKKSIIIIQIEHIEAVNNLDEIFEETDVDAFIIGPYDLSASLGVPGDFEHPSVTAALEKVQRFVLKNNITAGFHSVAAEPELVKKRHDEGYRFIAYSTDFLMFSRQCYSSLEYIRRKLLK